MKKTISLLLVLITLAAAFASFAVPASAEIPPFAIALESYHEIQNMGNDLYLNVYSGNNSNGTNLTCFRRDFTDAESFQFRSVNGGFSISSRCASNKVVNIYTSSAVKQNARVCLWNYTGNKSQLWGVRYIEEYDAFVIYSLANPNMVLSATGTANGSAVKMQAYKAGNKLQLWRSTAWLFSGGLTHLTGNSQPVSGKITTAQIQQVLDRYNYRDGMYWTVKESRNGNDCSAKTKSWKDALYATTCAASAYGSYKSWNFASQWECHGFASYVMSCVTGTQVRPTYNGGAGWTKISGEKNVKSLQVGDIIRTSGHTALVLSVNGDGTCTFAEVWGSVGCQINIGKFNNKCSTLAQIKSAYNVEYVYRYVG